MKGRHLDKPGAMKINHTHTHTHIYIYIMIMTYVST